MLLLEAIYLVTFLFWSTEDGIFKVVNKVTELGSQIILIHFVLELSFVVFVVKANDSFDVLLKKIKTYKWRYIASMAFASTYSIIIIIAYSINRASPDTYREAKWLRTLQLYALLSRLISENLAFLLFTISALKLIRLKRQAGPFSTKERLVLAYLGYLFVANYYFILLSIVQDMEILLPLSTVQFRTKDTLMNRVFFFNTLILFKVFDYSNCLGLLYLFYSMTNKKPISPTKS